MGFGMPDFGMIGSGIGSLGAAAGDLITQQGYYNAARHYTKAGNLEGEAADIFGQNAGIARASGELQKSQARRQIYRSESSTEAAAGGAGLRGGGSVGDILRSSVQQGALQLGIIGANSEIQVNSYLQQQKGAQVAQEGYYAESDNATTQGNAAGAKSAYDTMAGIAGIGGGLLSAFSFL